MPGELWVIGWKFSVELGILKRERSERLTFSLLHFHRRITRAFGILSTTRIRLPSPIELQLLYISDGIWDIVRKFSVELGILKRERSERLTFSLLHFHRRITRAFGILSTTRIRFPSPAELQLLYIPDGLWDIVRKFYVELGILKRERSRSA